MRFRILHSLIGIIFFTLISANAPAKPSGTVKFAYFTKPAFYLRHLVLEPLVISAKGQVKPMLAQRWKWINSKTLEVDLRQNVRFHDGHPFDAEAAKTNFDFFKDSIYPVNLRRYFKNIQCEIIDDHALRFRLPFPDSLFLPQLSKIFQIAPTKLKELTTGGKYFWGSVPETGLWGTGPFLIEKGHTGASTWSDEISLRANNDYWDKRYPKVKQIILFDPAKRFGWPREEAWRLASRAIAEGEGRIDIAPSIHTLTLQIALGKHSKIEKIGRSIRFGLFNMRKPNSIWRDIRLRRAVNLALNRRIFKELTMGNARIHSGLIAKGQMGHHPDLKPYSFDPQQAKALIREAGFKDGLKIKVILPRVLWKMAPPLFKMFSDVGIDAEIKLLRTEDFVKKYRLNILDRPIQKQDWDICWIKCFAFANHPFLDIYRLYFEKKGKLRWGIVDPMLQGLIDRFRQEMDEESQNRLLRQCEEIVHNKAFILYLFSLPNTYTFNKDVRLSSSIENEQSFLREIELLSGHWSLRD